MKVHTVVVTFKRPDMLNNCLNAIINASGFKSTHVHVVVNSNDDATKNVIVKYMAINPGLLTYEIFDNLGPAGGFHYGLKHFLNSDCDYVWLMDDDVIPERNCLQELVKSTKDSSYIIPKVLTPYSDEIYTFGWSGILLSRSVVEKVGLPLKNLFYWIEDTEYLQNRIMRSNRITPIRSKSAIVEHLYERKSTRPSWYYYYVIRNTLYYRLNIFPLNSRGRKRLIKMFLGSFYRICFKEPYKFKKFKMMFLGTYHALVGKLGKIEKFHS